MVTYISNSATFDCAVLNEQLVTGTQDTQSQLLGSPKEIEMLQGANTWVAAHDVAGSGWTGEFLAV